MSLLNKLVESMNESTRQYRTTADLEVSVESGELFNSPASTPVQFDIDIEFRSWGIKQIDVHVGGKQTVVMGFYRGEEEFEKDVELDFDAAVIEESSRLAGGITLGSVRVVLDKDFRQKSLTVEVLK